MSFLESLRGSLLFKGVSEDDLKSLLGLCDVTALPKGTVLFQEGEISHDIYVVAEGRLGVRRHIVEKKADCMPLCPVIAEHGAGETVGEFSFFDDKPRSAEVFAMTDARVLVLTPGAFRRFTDEFPRAAQRITENILRIVIFRMRKTNERLSIALEWGWDVHGYLGSSSDR